MYFVYICLECLIQYISLSLSTIYVECTRFSNVHLDNIHCSHVYTLNVIHLIHSGWSQCVFVFNAHDERFSPTHIDAAVLGINENTQIQLLYICMPVFWYSKP